MLPGKKLSPIDLVNMASRRWWLISIPPVLTLFVALLASSRVPDLYQSDMLIAVDPQRVPDEFVKSTVTLGMDRRIDSISVQVLSRTNLERMINTLGLYSIERTNRPIEDVVKQMRESIVVDLERAQRDGEGPNAFHVRFTHKDPTIAAQVTHELGTLFVVQNTTDRGALAEATNSFLDDQLGEARVKLEAQERRLEAFRESHGQSLPTQMQANMQAMQSMQLQVQALVESLARDRDRKQMLERLHRDAVNEPPTPPSVARVPDPSSAVPLGAQSAQQDLAAAKASLAALQIRYKDDHPDVIRTKRLIGELEPKARAEGVEATSRPPAAEVAPVDAARRERLRQMLAEIESLDRQTSFKESEERRVRSEIATFQRRVEAVPGLESEWAVLTRDYETQQLAYRDLLAKSGNAKVAAALEDQQIGELFRIVDPAGVPVHPLPSIRRVINLAGLGLGLLLGAGFAAFLEWRDKSFRTDSDVLDVIALPVLASVPRIETNDERSSRHRRTRLLYACGAICLAGMGVVTWMLKLWKSVV